MKYITFVHKAIEELGAASVKEIQKLINVTFQVFLSGYKIRKALDKLIENKLVFKYEGLNKLFDTKIYEIMY